MGRVARDVPSHWLCLVLLLGCSSESKTLNQTEAITSVPLEKGSFDKTNFRMAFAEPQSDLESLDVGPAGLVIKVEPFNFSPTATWSLYRTEAFEDLTTAKPLYENLPIGVKEVTWATASTPAGSYYLFLEGRSNGERSLFFLPTEIKVSSVDVTGAPQVVINTILDEKVFAPENSLTVDYSAVTPSQSPMRYSVYWSGDDGQTWTPSTEDVSVTNATLDFDESFQQGARYKVRVDASSVDGLGSAVSTGYFGFSPERITYEGHVRDVVLAKCATSGCHDAGGSAAASFDATRWDDVQNGFGTFTGILSNQDKILERPRTENNMPPQGSPQLTPDERDLIALWSWMGFGRR